MINLYLGIVFVWLKIGTMLLKAGHKLKCKQTRLWKWICVILRRMIMPNQIFEEKANKGNKLLHLTIDSRCIHTQNICFNKTLIFKLMDIIVHSSYFQCNSNLCLNSRIQLFSIKFLLIIKLKTADCK